MPSKIKLHETTSLDIVREYTVNGRNHVEIRCVCGTIFDSRRDYINKKIKDNKVIHCGCLDIMDLTNTKYNLLTPIKIVGRLHGKALWRCKCDCGNYTQVVASRITSGEIKSCGCLLNNKGIKRNSYRGIGNLSGYFWSSIKASAKSRGINFELTKEFAWDLFVKQGGKCAISNVDITMCDSRKDKNIENHTASLDRIDSSKGYTEENVWWVHKHVNKMKQEYPFEHFIDICGKIYLNNKAYINTNIRPTWEQYFINIAQTVSKRSHDAQTKHGCVITNPKNQIIGTGYNGFPVESTDLILANTRPQKYDNIIHAEINAITNCIISPHTFEKCTAYITGHPCYNCLITLWNANIRKIYYLTGQSFADRELEKDMVEQFLNSHNLELIEVFN
jgi:dCMP deaminase